MTCVCVCVCVSVLDAFLVWPPIVQQANEGRQVKRVGRHVEGADPWLRTNGDNTNGAATKVINVGRLGEKVHPGTFGKYPKGPSANKNMKFAVTPLALTPFVPCREPGEGSPQEWVGL